MDIMYNMVLVMTERPVNCQRHFGPRSHAIDRRPFLSQLDLHRVACHDHRGAQQFASSISALMEAVSATGTLVGLAIPVFQCAKSLRDRIKLVRYPHHLLRTLTAFISIFYPCSQVASEKAELLAALTEYEKDISLLEALYNSNKELLDQHTLDTDLKTLAEYAWSCFPSASQV